MEETQSLLELEVDQETGQQLIEASKWARFFGILVSVATAVLFLLLMLSWSSMNSLLMEESDQSREVGQLGLIFLIAFLLFIAAIIAIIMVFLIKGANGIRNGIRNKDQVTFNAGLANMRNAFGMYAVISIVLLLLSMIGLITN